MKERQRTLERKRTTLKRKSTKLESAMFWSSAPVDTDLNQSDHMIAQAKRKGSIMLPTINENLKEDSSRQQNSTIDKIDNPEIDFAVLQNQIDWVSLQLSHHIINKRSIYFVIDCEFE